jgi:hypothetical protein
MWGAQSADPNVPSEALMNKMLDSNLAKGLSGAAGQYFVAAELSRRGLIATVTLRNARGIDVLVSNAMATRSLSIQVKTNQYDNNKWLLDKKAEDLVARDFAWERLGF